jgi:hypothetical protein
MHEPSFPQDIGRQQLKLMDMIAPPSTETRRAVEDDRLAKHPRIA